MDVGIEVKSNTDDLKRLVRGINKDASVKIGIFNNTIADVARKLEFGDTSSYVPQIHQYVNIPARSFLVTPTENTKFNEINNQEETLISPDSMKKIAELVGEEIKKSIADTFKGEGNGNWQPNPPEWTQWKEEHGYDTRILHMTGALQEAIESKVE